MSEQVQVFISYCREDLGIAKKLYVDLKNAGLEPWLDTEDLLPGQLWKTAIDKAIRESSYFLVLLSFNSVTKEKGFINNEIKKALESFQTFNPSKIYIIPVRIDNCEPNHEELYALQWTDIFHPYSYDEGLKKILKVIKKDKSYPQNVQSDIETQTIESDMSKRLQKDEQIQPSNKPELKSDISTSSRQALRGRMSKSSEKASQTRSSNKPELKTRFMFVFGYWVLFIATIIVFFFAVFFVQKYFTPVSGQTRVSVPDALMAKPKFKPPESVVEAEEPLVKNSGPAVSVEAVVVAKEPLGKNEVSVDSENQDHKPSAIFQLKGIETKKIEGGLTIIVKANQPITDYSPSYSMLMQRTFYIDFPGTWEEPKKQYRRYQINDDIVKEIRSDNKENKMRLAVYLSKKIQTPTIQQSPEGLIITIKSLNKSGERGEKAIEKTKTSIAPADGATTETDKNQILGIKKEPSEGGIKITVSTNNPIGMFKYFLRNKLLNIEFKGKWGISKKLSYEGGDDIVEKIDIDNKSPDKTKIFFYFNEGSPRLDTNVDKPTPKELIVTIKKSEQM